MARTDDNLYFRDLNEIKKREFIHSWNVDGRLDLIHAVNNGEDVAIGGYFLDNNDIEIVG